MTMSRLIATGRGQIHVRATVEGWPVEFVTASSMAQTMGDGRERADGLKLSGITIGANLDLPSGKIDSKGSRVEVHGVTRDFAAVASLRKKPTLRTYLTGYVDRTDTTIPVFSTDGWPTSGVLHLNTEAIAYTGVTSTTFTGCTRGVWDTVAQAHFVQDGGGAFEAESAGLAYPPVTNHPASLEGRRVFFHLYSAADGHGGDGNLRWFGVAVTDAKFEGLKASFQVDAPTAILKQQIGGDVVQELPIRGIYYPWSCPFVLPLTLCDSAGNGEAEPGLSPALVKVTGHFETEADFCDALTTEIENAALAAWGVTWNGIIYAQPTSGGFELVYSTPATGTRYVRIRPDAGGPAERAFAQLLSGAAAGSFDQLLGAEWVGDGETAPADPLDNDATYRVQFSTSFPRAYFGDADTPWTRAGLDVPAEAANAPGTRIYLGGLIALAAGIIVYDTTSSDPSRAVPIGLWDTGDRWVQHSRPEARIAGLFALHGPATRFKAGRELATGNIGDLLAYLVANSPDYANVGAMPLLRETDIETTAVDDGEGGTITLAEHVVRNGLGGPLANARRYVALGQDVTLEELAGPDIVAAGMHWTIESNGSLALRRVRLAASTDPAAFTITARQTVGTLPTLEASALWGFLSALHLETGYDPIADEYTGVTHHVPNVQGSAPNRAAKTLTIEQKSMDLTGPPVLEDVIRLARVWLGLLGQPYDIVTLQVPMLFFDAQLGDAIKVTSDHVLNDDGTMGIEDKLGILIGYEWELETGKGGFTLLMHRRNISGYAPGFRIASQADLGGDLWDMTLNVTELTDQLLSTWYEVGDAVRVVQQDATTPTEIQGTITAIDDGTETITVQLASAWTVGVSEWAIESLDSDQYDQADNLARFVFVSDSSARLSYSDATVNAQVLS